MEPKSINQSYRDIIAAKVTEKRQAGDHAGAQEILDQQRGIDEKDAKARGVEEKEPTTFYTEAEKEHREGDQLKTRTESLERRAEEKRAELEKIEALIKKINEAKDISENNTPAETKEEKADKEKTQEGFDTHTAKAETELQNLELENNKETENEVIQNTENTENIEKISPTTEKTVFVENLIVESNDEPRLKTIEMEQEAPVDLIDTEDIQDSLIETKTSEQENSTSQEDPGHSDQENNEVTRTAELQAIIDSAQKSLDWMKGKNAPWATDNMVMREQRKLDNAKKAQAEGKNIETTEEKSTIGAALVQMEERNQILTDKVAEKTEEVSPVDIETPPDESIITKVEQETPRENIEKESLNIEASVNETVEEDQPIAIEKEQNDVVELNELENLQETTPAVTETTSEVEPVTMKIEREILTEDIQKESSITNITKNEHGADVVYFDGADTADFENEAPQKKRLLSIVASAQKVLDVIKGKSPSWATESMLRREQRKLEQAQETLTDGEDIENKKGKPTVAAVLTFLEERKQELTKKSPDRAERIVLLAKMIIAGGMISAAPILSPEASASTHEDDTRKNPIEKVDNEKLEKVMQDYAKYELTENDSQEEFNSIIDSLKIDHTAEPEDKLENNLGDLSLEDVNETRMEPEDLVKPKTENITDSKTENSQLAQINSSVIDLIKKEEGFRTKAYPDVGKWAIGYGNQRHPNGKPVRPGDVILASQANEYLANGIETHSNWKKIVQVPLNESQEAALASFEYNLGAGIWQKKNARRIIDAINNSDFAKAGKLMLPFNTSRGRRVDALVERRRTEANLLNSYTKPEKQSEKETVSMNSPSDKFLSDLGTVNPFNTK